MSDEPKPHHYAAKVLIGPVYSAVPDDEPEGVVTAVRRVRIITVNGEIWEQIVSGFGDPSEMDVVANWDATYETDWTRIET